MAANMEKFSTQLDRDVLIALKEYAYTEIQSVVNIALRETQGSKARHRCLPEKYPAA